MAQYSEAISKYAENKFLHDGVTLITNARVSAVTSDSVVYTTRTKDGKTETHTIPTNFVLWSTGIAMNPFTARVSSLLYAIARYTLVGPLLMAVQPQPGP